MTSAWVRWHFAAQVGGFAHLLVAKERLWCCTQSAVALHYKGLSSCIPRPNCDGVCSILPPFPTTQCLLNSCGTAGPQSWPWSGSCTVMEAMVLFRHSWFIAASFSYSAASCSYSFKKLAAVVQSLYSGLGRSVLPA